MCATDMILVLRRTANMKKLIYNAGHFNNLLALNIM